MEQDEREKDVRSVKSNVIFNPTNVSCLTMSIRILDPYRCDVSRFKVQCARKIEVLDNQERDVGVKSRYSGSCIG